MADDAGEKMLNQKTDLNEVCAALKALLIAVEFNAPPKNFGVDNPCFEARVPVQFVTDAHAALKKVASQ